MPRHSFVAATCIGLAEEWAREMDRRIVPIIREPDQPEQAASALLRQVLVVVISDMNTRLVSLGLKVECDLQHSCARRSRNYRPNSRTG